MDQKERIDRIAAVKSHLDNLHRVREEYKAELFILQNGCDHRKEDGEYDVFKHMLTYRWTCGICGREPEDGA